jgi:5'-nucleotidase
MKPTRSLLAALVLVLAPLAASAQPLRVLVTNDDGVGAAGIDTLVNELTQNPNLAVIVIAPATNQSGSGDNRTNGPINVEPATTASAYPAKKVFGFPADSTLFGILQELQSDPPDLVVSGINNGQNIAEATMISGTVGAALWAARLGIPAFAVSAGLGASPNYSQAAQYTATLVEQFRVRKSFQKKMVEKDAPFTALVLNVNFPTCTTGSVRGVRLVDVGRFSTVTGYNLTNVMGSTETWTPITATGPAGSDCTSALEEPATDLEGFAAGFATVTPLAAERGTSTRRTNNFRFVERLF